VECCGARAITVNVALGGCSSYYGPLLSRWVNCTSQGPCGARKKGLANRNSRDGELGGLKGLWGLKGMKGCGVPGVPGVRITILQPIPWHANTGTRSNPTVSARQHFCCPQMIFWSSFDKIEDTPP